MLTPREAYAVIAARLAADGIDSAGLADAIRVMHRLAYDAPTDWYAAEDSVCGKCPHGPRWHDDLSGCTRMLGGWCPCERVYAPGATGPDDYSGTDGSYYQTEESPL